MQVIFSSMGILIVLFAGGAYFAAENAADPSFARYYYFDQERPLSLDSSRVAAFRGERLSEEALEEVLRSAGWESVATGRRSMAGWSLFTLNEASGAPTIAGGPEEMVAGAIERLLLADRHRRFFFTPVFDGRFGEMIVTPEVLVRFRENVSELEIEALFGDLETLPLNREPFGGMTGSWRLTGDLRSGIRVLDLANRLARRPEVEWAEPEMFFRGRSTYVPGDSGFGVSWGLHNTGQSGGTVDVDIDAPEAWDLTTGDPSVLTVVIDVGVEQTHPDIHQAPGEDFTWDELPGDGGPANRCDNHGTPVAGVVSAVIDGGGAAVGAAPGTRVASARTFYADTTTCDGSWWTSSSWTVDALDWASLIGARVTNNSNGYGFTSSAIADKYAETMAAGLVHFASAGNESGGAVNYPARLPSVQAVSAVERTGALANFSNTGPEVSLSGPGVSIFTTDRTGGDGWTGSSYVYASGTSFASPMAAGVAALLSSRAPLLTAAEIRNLLQGQATDLGAAGWDSSFGWGLVNAASSLSALEIFEDSFESGDTSAWSGEGQ